VTPPVVAVTGAGRGIGRAIALAFAAAGYDVAMGARSTDAMEGVADEIAARGREALVVATDVTSIEDTAHFAAATNERFGRVDALVNNSGVGGPSGPLWELDPAEWEATLAVNVRGVFLCARAFLPGMIERGTGAVVTIGSMTGKRPLLGRTPYATSKTALIGLTRTLAAEAGPHGIRVNLISPGFVAGPRLDWVITAQAETRGLTEDEVRAEFEDESPLRRLTSADDVAAAAVFLASDAAAAITGADLNVSSGVVTY
jgi:NAD(P)-dependent dehydrogenase (short-subunit alcohol dehydrogenase family)